MTISSRDLIPTTFNDDLRAILSHSYTEYIEHGGRASCKSSLISLAGMLLMESNPDYNWLVVRKVADTLSESVFEQILWAIEKLGLGAKYKATTSPLRIVNIYTGQRIVFRGADRPEKIKSIKLKRGYFALTWFEELTEFTPRDVTTIKLSTMRGGDKYWIFYSFNPPSAVRNWCNEFAKEKKPTRLVHLSDYRTTPAEWLGQAFLDEAEHLKATNERAYKNVFLGEATGTGRNVFENIKLETITDEQIESFDFKEIGLDWGYYPDPLALNVTTYDPARRVLYCYGELELYKAGNSEAFDSVDEYLQKLGLDILVDRITADSAEPKSIADFHAYGANIRGANKGRLGSTKNRGETSRNASFKWLQSLDAIIIDPTRCPRTADEFSLYEYQIEKKSGEIMAGYPDGQPDHHIDAARYGNEDNWRHSGE